METYITVNASRAGWEIFNEISPANLVLIGDANDIFATIVTFIRSNRITLTDFELD